MKFEIFNYCANSNFEYLHGNGESASNQLISKLNIAADFNILEIGFGIGSTLMKISKKFPQTSLFGIEHSPKMYTVANLRKKLNGNKNIQLYLLDEDQSMPFEDQFFDIIYVESVLGTT